MTHSTSLPPDIREAFQAHSELFKICGAVRAAKRQTGLSNRVYRLEADMGCFFLRLPRPETAGMVDRFSEAWNIDIAAGLSVALPPVFCEPESGILLTPAVEPVSLAADALAVQLGKAIGRLHASGAVFKGQLSADRVIEAQREVLSARSDLLNEVKSLESVLVELSLLEAGSLPNRLVPSHGDLSPGNCLATSDTFWLIDWEYSAMAAPEWDIAYTVLEHAFSVSQERVLVGAYQAVVPDARCPTPRQVEIMKVKCDAVSALWALEQLRQESDRTDFLAFARERRDRALSRAANFIR
ncbi:choline kinase family protein [Roseibium sp. HPY-6]|uniref:choline kinase family protein n=1 Tax=Roseibium sp. HPY-6 TaxID=3229852 RepID=UPI00338DA1F1